MNNSTQMGASGQPVMQLIPILLIIILFYALVIYPQKKRQKKMSEFLAGLKVGDRVVTGGGLVGSVAAIRDRQVDLEIAPGVTVTVMKQAILTLES